MLVLVMANVQVTICVHVIGIGKALIALNVSLFELELYRDKLEINF